MAEADEQVNATPDTSKSEESIKDKKIATPEAKEVLSKKDKADINKRAIQSKQEKQDLVAMQKTNALDPIAYAQLKEVAQDYIDSQAVPASLKNVNQVLRVLQAANTLGVTYEDALSGMYYVNGMLNIYGKLTPTVLRNAGYNWDYYDEDENYTTVSLKLWKGGSKFDPESELMKPDPDTVSEFYKDTFTFEDAKKSNGANGVGFKDGKNRQRKLRYEALSLMIHTRVPHVLNGVAGIAEVSERYKEEMDEPRYQRVDKKNIQDRMEKDTVVEGEVIDQDFTPKPVEPVKEQG